MHNCKVVATPMNTNEKLQLEDGTEAVDPSSYRSLSGGLNYWTHTHPDIMFSVSVVSRFMPNPTKQPSWSSEQGVKVYCWNCKFWNLVLQEIRFQSGWVQ